MNWSVYNLEIDDKSLLEEQKYFSREIVIICEGLNNLNVVMNILVNICMNYDT
jgi:hypothetical protein